MPLRNKSFDVAIIGGGPAGITAAAVLGKKGYTTIVLEAGVFPGAENWSGTAYFAENLVREEAFGSDLFEQAPYERNLVKRGFSMYDGVSHFGLSYKNDDTFRNCYTVLRPVFDRYLSEKVQEMGVTVLPETTVQSLIRENGRVIGCHTERGPVYAECTFLAEGDAAHLTTQEGYEQEDVERKGPEFLQGIKEVIELEPEVIEERFNVEPGKGSASEVLVRNGNFNGSSVRLNMGGFIYTNRNSISIGLVLPVHNLKTQFQGDHNALMEWFKNLPEINRLIEGGEMTSFGTKIIRGGGYQEIPQIVDNGLAIGGAATGIGLDFPYPNFTGPATYMGYLFGKAYHKIRNNGEEPTKSALQNHYRSPLEDSHYYKNVRYLQDFPSYVEKTEVFFERQIDLVAGTGHIATRKDLSTGKKLRSWSRFLRSLLSDGKWKQILADRKEVSEIFGIPSHIRDNLKPDMVVRWLWNSFRALLPEPSKERSGPGELEFHFRSGEQEDTPETPFIFHWLKNRLKKPLKKAFNHVYTNDDTPIEEKLKKAVGSVMEGASFLDLFLVVPFATLITVLLITETVRDWLKFRVFEADVSEFLERPEQKYIDRRRNRGAMEPDAIEVRDSSEKKLGTISYYDTDRSHIKVLWPDEIENRKELEDSSLWHICPAWVYDVNTQYLGNPGVIVNFENCIKCETCWRGSDDVHWSRATEHRLIYQTYSPSGDDLVHYLRQRSLPSPDLPAVSDSNRNNGAYQKQSELLDEKEFAENPETREAIQENFSSINEHLYQLEIRLRKLPHGVEDQPLAVEKGRIRYLKSISASMKFHADQIDVALKGNDLLEVRRHLKEQEQTRLFDTWNRSRELVTELHDKIDRKKFFWSEVIGEKLLDHHLPQFKQGISRLRKDLLGEEFDEEPEQEMPGAPLRKFTEQLQDRSDVREKLRERIEDVFDHQRIKAFEKNKDFTEPERELLDEFRRTYLEVEDPASHPETRILIEELARRDPSLAWLTTHHLWARSLLQNTRSENRHNDVLNRHDWLCVAFRSDGDPPVVEPGNNGSATVRGTAKFVPAKLASGVVVADGNQLCVVSLSDSGIDMEEENPCGFIGAGVNRLTFSSPEGPAFSRDAGGDPTDTIALLKNILPYYQDLINGASGYLLQRAKDHARSRVQFPGQFQDEAGYDTIAKFGAVKEMLAEMEAKSVLLKVFRETPDDQFCPEHRDAGIAARRFLAGKYFGPEEGSFGYNAGQVFGGTAYSEDDFISKFYRDSSVARFLAGTPDDLCLWLGRELAGAKRDEGDRFPNDENEWFQHLYEHGPEEPMMQEPINEFKNARDRFDELLEQLRYPGGDVENSPAVYRQTGEVFAEYLGVRALLLRVYVDVRAGKNRELDLQVCEYATNELMEHLRNLKISIDRDPTTEELGRLLRDEGAMEPVPKADLPWDYGHFLESNQTHRSGQFLLESYDPETPRFYPEMVENDGKLGPFTDRVRNEVRDRYYSENYPEGTFNDGLCFPRYLEKIHTFPGEDLEYLLKNGYLRIPISSDLGGEGHWKSQYYLMCNQFMRFADPSMALVIMGNTSIGTTPIQIGLKQDLPRARKELASVRDNPEQLDEILDRIEEILESLSNPNIKELTKKFEETEELVREHIRNSGVLKYISGGFLRSFYEAARAGQQKDLDRFSEKLHDARDQFEEIEEGIDDRLAEYPRREEAHQFHLKMIAAGWVSAFALTEPTAGSDSGGVKTVAKLKKRPVYSDDDGRDYFLPDEDKPEERRYIIDPRHIEFDYENHRTLYRFDEEKEPVQIRFDEYDYEKDAPGKKKRYYTVSGEKRYFHDIGRIREDENGDRYYEFFELNGAKMWITNGRMAKMFCLYATTDEGVTGFMVDRHAEGLVVGQDEEKMGQRGSPTNELSLKGVRVPRENVIGYRGRGQVNALETLNAGRIGLAFCATGIMKDIISRGRRYLGNGNTEKSDRELSDYLFGRMAEQLVATESLGHELVGYTDHPGTDSIRMESAIGKYSASEGVHDLIDLGERLRGIAGQTGKHDIEKKRRDARVINIYEGTNEVQRFLLLKDLVQKIHENRSEREDADPETSAHPDVLKKLQDARDRLFDDLEQAVNAFNQQTWQQVSYQPVFFRLSEMAGLLKQMFSALSRMDFVEEHLEETSYQTLVEKSGRQYIQRQIQHFERLSDQYRHRLAYLKEDRYPPRAQIGFLALEEEEEEPGTDLPEVSVDVDELRIAVPVKSVPQPAPKPRVRNGEFVEPVHQMNPADRTALEQALQIRERAPEAVNVDLFAVAKPDSSRVEPVLRRGLALGADRATKVTCENGTDVDSQRAALALEDALDNGTSHDLVFMGSKASDTSQGATGPLLGAATDRFHLTHLTGLTDVKKTGDDIQWSARGANWNGEVYRGTDPAILTFDPLSFDDDFRIDDYIRARKTEIQNHSVSVNAPDVSLKHKLRTVQGRDEEDEKATTPEAAADKLLEAVGVSDGGQEQTSSVPLPETKSFSEDAAAALRDSGLFFTPPLVESSFPRGVVPAARAARSMCDKRDVELTVVVPKSTSDADSSEALGQLQSVGPEQILLVETKDIDQFSWRGYTELLERMEADIDGTPSLWMGTEWWQEVFCRYTPNGTLSQNGSAQGGTGSNGPARWFSVEHFRSENGYLELETPIMEEQAEIVARINGNQSSLMLTFQEDVQNGNGVVRNAEPDVYRYEPELAYDPDDDNLSRFLQRIRGAGEVESLEDARVIIDVGYGAGDAEGMKKLTEPFREVLEEELDLDGVMVGATRKVTQDLELLPNDRQIGQTGVRVNPEVLFALGVSGAPQHIDYIGERATIFAFNIDPDAPLMNLNEERPAPIVHPIEGDMFETVPEFLEAIRDRIGESSD